MKRTPCLNDLDHARTRYRSRPRRGTVLIIAMIILLILMAISTVLISSVVQTRTQLIREEQCLQAVLLAEAGLRRGVAKLRTDREFRSETWQIPAEPATGLDPGQVAIAVTNASDAPEQSILTATAEYPMGTPHPIRITRTLSFPNQP